MPQMQIVRGASLCVVSFVDGVIAAKVPAGIAEARVLAMCEYLENQGNPEEASLLLDCYLELGGNGRIPGLQ